MISVIYSCQSKHFFSRTVGGLSFLLDILCINCLVIVSCISSTLQCNILNPTGLRCSTIDFFIVFVWVKRPIETGSGGSFRLESRVAREIS